MNKRPLPQIGRSALPIFATLAAIPLAACTATPPPDRHPHPSPNRDIVLTEDDDGKTTNVALRQRFEVSLGGNGGTGYRWELTPTPGIKVVREVVNPHSPGLPGGPYTHNFILRTETPGPHRLTFRLHRAWEKSAPAAKTVQFTVHAHGLNR